MRVNFERVSSTSVPRTALFAVLLVAPLVLSACVTRSDDPVLADRTADGSEFGSLGPAGPNDPLENVNRAIFAVNLQLDRFIIEPIAITYTELTPEPVREGVTTILRNLSLPLTAVHQVLQGKFGDAAQTTVRFVTNAVTLWVGDLSDMPYPNEDAGQTLAVAGIGGGPFLVLPLLGPSNVRDALGRLIDALIDPVGVVIGPTGGIARTAVDGIDTRARLGDQLAELEAGSIDFYATVRSLYLQNREAQIRDGDVDPLHAVESSIIVELGDEFGGDFTEGFGSDFEAGDDADDDPDRPAFGIGDEGGEIGRPDEQGRLEDDFADGTYYDGVSDYYDELAAKEKDEIDIAELKKAGIDVELLSAVVAP